MNMNKYILVTTAHRGVFAGELVEENDNGKTVILKNTRCAIYWSTKHGFLELAEKGPNSSSRIGAKASGCCTLFDVTSATECTEKAQKAWENA